MRAELFTISRDGPGRLSTMARPRGGDWLEDEITALAASGVSVLVSLLTPAEAIELQLGGEEEAARAAGLAWHSLPTPDLHVPHPASALALARVLLGHLNRAEGVAIHCRAGIGRSSVLAAIILILEGAGPDQAWQRISAARGMTVPDTRAQRDAVAALAASLTPGPGR